jgi:hypothetical protein
MLLICIGFAAWMKVGTLQSVWLVASFTKEKLIQD